MFENSSNLVAFVYHAIETTDLNCAKDSTTHKREAIPSEQYTTGISI